MAIAGRSIPFFVVTIAILYLMVKYVWSSVVASLGDAHLSVRNIEDYLVRNLIIVIIILILTEANIEYFTWGATWLN